jgi:hypothetical protein
MKAMIASMLVALWAAPALGQAPAVRRLEVFRPVGGGSEWIDTAAVRPVGQDTYRFPLMFVLPTTLTLADGTTHDRMEATMELDCRRKRSRVMSMKMLSGEQVVLELPGSGEPEWTRAQPQAGLLYCPVLRRSVHP